MAARIMVTGGAGLIGSAVIRQLIGETDAMVLNIDKLTYAASPDALTSLADDPRYDFLQADICDQQMMREAFARHRPDAVLHLAAETHVDRSIDRPAAFIKTNVVGTQALLDAALDYWRGLNGEARARFRFVQVSTDEVFGSLPPTGLFTESSPYAPNSPYAASKAAADHLVRAWHLTFGLPTIITNCSNNYGPYQFPENRPADAIAISSASSPTVRATTSATRWILRRSSATSAGRAARRSRADSKRPCAGISTIAHGGRRFGSAAMAASVSG